MEKPVGLDLRRLQSPGPYAGPPGTTTATTEGPFEVTEKRLKSEPTLHLIENFKVL